MTNSTTTAGSNCLFQAHVGQLMIQVDMQRRSLQDTVTEPNPMIRSDTVVHTVVSRFKCTYKSTKCLEGVINHQFISPLSDSKIPKTFIKGQ